MTAQSGFDSYAQLLESLDPVARQRILSLGTIDDKQARLQAQLQQAQALRQDPGQHSTAIGAALAGIGNIASGVKGALDETRLNGQLDALVGQRQQGRDAYNQAIIDMLRRKRPPYALPGMQAPQPEVEQPPIDDLLAGRLPVAWGGG